jgi:hypothetical protein
MDSDSPFACLLARQPTPRRRVNLWTASCSAGSLSQDRFRPCHRRNTKRVTVQLFLTGDPATESLPWQHLLDLDTTASVRVEDRPADELLPLLLSDARHTQPSARADFL